ncbi:MAG: GspH/FimT family protein [Planctomycetota bacterium]
MYEVVEQQGGNQRMWLMRKTVPTNVGRVALPQRRGFSLIELTLVVALVAVLAAIAGPRFANASARQRAVAAANRIEADIALAQNLAQATSDDYTLRFTTKSSYQCIAADATTDQTVDLRADPYGVSLAYTLDNAGSDLVFNGFGLPNSGGELTVSGGGKVIVLTLNPVTGEVTRQ